jgi:hypothetical protein
MRKITTIVFCLIFFGFSANTYAQFNKLKDKAKNTTEKLKSKDDSNTSKSASTKTSESKSSSSDNESSSVDFSELETQKMEWTSTFERLEKKWDVLLFAEYAQKKAEYTKFYANYSKAYTAKNKKAHSDSYTEKLIATIDGYYSPTVSEEVMASIKEKVMRSFDEEDWTVYPADRMKDIDVALKEVENTKAFLTGQDPALNEFEKSLIEQKSIIQAYVDGGGLKKRAAEVEKRMVEKRRLHDAGMTDQSVVNVVNSKIDKAKYGTPQRVVITSRTWEIEENEFGNPKLKFVKVDIATKKADGKCYYVKGSVAQKHQGGGVYGDKYLNIYYTEGEMNCQNINE